MFTLRINDSENNTVQPSTQQDEKQDSVLSIINEFTESIFSEALAEGDLNKVKRLLVENEGLITVKGDFGDTALLSAVRYGHLPIVEWLLQTNYASIKEKNKYGLTALLLAAACGHLAIVQWLLLKGNASIKEKDNSGYTALLWAAGTGQLDILKWLLKEGYASIQEVNQEGMTALMVAIAHDKGNAVQWLLKEGGASIQEFDKLNITGRTTLNIMSRTDLYEKLIDINYNNPLPYDVIGRVFFKSKRYSSAFEMFDLAITNAPEDKIIQSNHMKARKKLSKQALQSLLSIKLKQIKENNNEMTVLYLKDYALEIKQITELIEALRNNQSITHVILDNNPLKDVGLSSIANMLETNTTIITLTLKKNGSTTEALTLYYPRIQAYLQRNTLLAKNQVTIADIKELDIIQLTAKDFLLLLQKHPLNALDFSTKNLKHNTMSALQVLQSINTITLLNLSENQLDDKAAQLLASYLKVNRSLIQLNLANNKITEYGTKEVFEVICGNPILHTMDISQNLLYVSEAEFRKLEKTIQPDEKSIVQRKINVSHNYFMPKTHVLLANHSIFSLTTDQKEGKSLLLENQCVTYEKYLTFLLRKAAVGSDPEHAMILVEGMHSNSQRFINVYDYRPDPENALKGKVGEKSYEPYRVVKDINGYQYICYPTTRVYFNRLKENIRSDKEKNLYYKKIGTQLSGLSSGRVYNCLTWAIAKLNESILPANKQLSEPQIFPLPSLYIRNQTFVNVNEEKNENKVQESSCRIM